MCSAIESHLDRISYLDELDHVFVPHAIVAISLFWLLLATCLMTIDHMCQYYRYLYIVNSANYVRKHVR